VLHRVGVQSDVVFFSRHHNAVSSSSFRLLGSIAVAEGTEEDEHNCHGSSVSADENNGVNITRIVSITRLSFSSEHVSVLSVGLILFTDVPRNSSVSWVHSIQESLFVIISFSSVDVDSNLGESRISFVDSSKEGLTGIQLEFFVGVIRRSVSSILIHVLGDVADLESDRLF